MFCPKCKKTPLKSGKDAARNLELDQCPECKGIWFDKGELSILLGSKAEKELSVPAFAAKAPDANCPRCGAGLFEFCYPGTLTLVDGCKQCAGVWLDNREWKTINKARDESNYINCPSCHARQKPGDSCIECGIVYAKHQSLDANPQSTTSINEQSYAANIPGLKGSLLRMIDNTIKKLSAGIF